MGMRKREYLLAGPAAGEYYLRQLYKKADFVDRELGISYYQDLHDRIAKVAKEFGDSSIETACGIFAALSPNNSQESNLEDMIRCLSAIPGRHETMGERWKKVVVHTYPANKAKAARIVAGVFPLDVLRGPKTRAFYMNLVNPMGSEDVTIDGHMVNIWNNRRVPLDSAGINESEYRMIERSVKGVADDLGLEAPNQLQATLWITWRRIHRIYYNPQYLLEF